jgi:rod shape-determining protein MreD
MIKKIIFLVFFFYLLALIQTSFLIHFNLSGIVPNFVLITIFFINLFERPEKKLGIVSAFLGGFYLDIFSLSFSGFFGFYTLISLALSLFIKFILRKHVSLPSIKKGR